MQTMNSNIGKLDDQRLATNQDVSAPPSPTPDGCFLCLACRLVGKFDTEFSAVRGKMFSFENTDEINNDDAIFNNDALDQRLQDVKSSNNCETGSPCDIKQVLHSSDLSSGDDESDDDTEGHSLNSDGVESAAEVNLEIVEVLSLPQNDLRSQSPSIVVEFIDDDTLQSMAHNVPAEDQLGDSEITNRDKHDDHSSDDNNNNDETASVSEDIINDSTINIMDRPLSKESLHLDCILMAEVVSSDTESSVLIEDSKDVQSECDTEPKMIKSDELELEDEIYNSDTEVKSIEADNVGLAQPDTKECEESGNQHNSVESNSAVVDTPHSDELFAEPFSEDYNIEPTIPEEANSTEQDISLSTEVISGEKTSHASSPTDSTTKACDEGIDFSVQVNSLENRLKKLMETNDESEALNCTDNKLIEMNKNDVKLESIKDIEQAGPHVFELDTAKVLMDETCFENKDTVTEENISCEKPGSCDHISSTDDITLHNDIKSDEHITNVLVASSDEVASADDNALHNEIKSIEKVAEDIQNIACDELDSCDHISFTDDMTLHEDIKSSERSTEEIQNIAFDELDSCDHISSTDDITHHEEIESSEKVTEEIQNIACDELDSCDHISYTDDITLHKEIKSNENDTNVLVASIDEVAYSDAGVIKPYILDEPQCSHSESNSKESAYTSTGCSENPPKLDTPDLATVEANDKCREWINSTPSGDEEDNKSVDSESTNNDSDAFIEDDIVEKSSKSEKSVFTKVKAFGAKLCSCEVRPATESPMVSNGEAPDMQSDFGYETNSIEVVTNSDETELSHSTSNIETGSNECQCGSKNILGQSSSEIDLFENEVNVSLEVLPTTESDDNHLLSTSHNEAEQDKESEPLNNTDLPSEIDKTNKIFSEMENKDVCFVDQQEKSSSNLQDEGQSSECYVPNEELKAESTEPEELHPASLPSSIIDAPVIESVEASEKCEEWIKSSPELNEEHVNEEYAEATINEEINLEPKEVAQDEIKNNKPKKSIFKKVKKLGARLFSFEKDPASMSSVLVDDTENTKIVDESSSVFKEGVTEEVDPDDVESPKTLEDSNVVLEEDMVLKASDCLNSANENTPSTKRYAYIAAEECTDSIKATENDDITSFKETPIEAEYIESYDDHDDSEESLPIFSVLSGLSNGSLVSREQTEPWSSGDDKAETDSGYSPSTAEAVPVPGLEKKLMIVHS